MYGATQPQLRQAQRATGKQNMANTLPNLDRDFLCVDLEFVGTPYQDVFGRKNNKTMAETLQHRRYEKFAAVVRQRYPESLDKPLGTALLSLKQDGDSFYREFLNPYGDLKYSTFRVASPKIDSAIGVYAYYEGANLRYIGRCRDSMKNRVTQGYGKIHPKNCYLDGQATNCHLNAKIAAALGTISLRFCPIEGKAEIERVERALIKRHSPDWNIQRV